MTEAASASRRWDWLASVATVLSIVACYGTLLLIGALSLLGVSLAVHNGLWAGAISLFAVLAAIGLALGYKRHHAPAPFVLGTIGTGLIVWVMFGPYSRLIELIGFAFLVVAAALDWRLKRRSVAISREH